MGIAQALLGNPPVLILDEPTVGLDPKQIIEIRNLIKNLGRNHTVVLSSHILAEVQAVCERILIINKGVIVADGTPDKLSHDLTSDHRLVARIEGEEREVLHNLRTIKNVVEVQSFGERSRASMNTPSRARRKRTCAAICSPAARASARRSWRCATATSRSRTCSCA